MGYKRKNWKKRESFLLNSRLDFFKRLPREKAKSLFSTKMIAIFCAIVFVVSWLWGAFQTYRLDNQIEALEQQIEDVETAYKMDSTEYHDLKNSPSLIEHIARENYYMKSKGEQIYILKKK